jgi:hypothetical protein
MDVIVDYYVLCLRISDTEMANHKMIYLVAMGEFELYQYLIDYMICSMQHFCGCFTAAMVTIAFVQTNDAAQTYVVHLPDGGKVVMRYVAGTPFGLRFFREAFPQDAAAAEPAPADEKPKEPPAGETPADGGPPAKEQPTRPKGRLHKHKKQKQRRPKKGRRDVTLIHLLMLIHFLNINSLTNLIHTPAYIVSRDSRCVLPNNFEIVIIALYIDIFLVR